MTNHLPVFGMVFSFPILAWGALRSSDDVDVKKVGFGILVVTALIAIPVYLTGEPAEETVESLRGVTKQIIERHEHLAMFALISVIVSGAVALVGLIVIRSGATVQRAAIFLTLLLSAFTSGMMGWTAKLGGEIRHTEIRSGAQANGPAAEQQRKRKPGTITIRLSWLRDRAGVHSESLHFLLTLVVVWLMLQLVILPILAHEDLNSKERGG